MTTLIIFSNFTYGHKVSPTSTGSYFSGTKSVGSTILFTGSSSHDNDSQTLNYTPKWEWDFDYAGTFHPGSPTTSSTVTHVYQSAGVKTIAVRYTDNDNQAGNIYTFQVTISGINRYYYAKDHLGNIRQTWDKNGNIAAAQDYYSYGEILRSYNASSGFENYKFTSKERDAESNLDYFGARYYESLTGRWMSADPLGRLYPNLSPYCYVSANPLRLVDPTGKWIGDFSAEYSSPEEGEREKKKRQEEEEQEKNIYSKQELTTISTSASRTSPWDLNGDGILQLYEAERWYRVGLGQAIIVDASKIIIDNVDPNELSTQYTTAINFEQRGPLEFGLVYGSLDLQLMGNNQVYIAPNDYDFQIGAQYDHPWNTFRGIIRNIGTWFGRIHAGDGEQFTIYFDNLAKLNYTPIIYMTNGNKDEK